MYRSSEVIRPKTKIRVELQKGDGTFVEGYVFVAGHERVLDLLNGRDLFLPFETEDGRYVMINKTAVAFVWPHDEQWMQSTYKATPIEPAPLRRPVRPG